MTITETKSSSQSRLAIVTGASSGIGQHIATRLAQLGYDIAFSYMGAEQDAEKTAESVKACGRNCFYAESDVGYSDQVEAFFAQAMARFGVAPQVVVNNAGVQTWASFLELREEDWDRVIRTNLKGNFLITQKAAALMVEHDVKGSIINIGSGCNKVPFPKLVDYSASKAAIDQLTRSAAIELGKYGIRVNCIGPGGIEIERTRREAPDYAKVWGDLAPLGRVGVPQDIADAVEFLASDKSSYVTGQTLYVDGGVFTKPNWPYTD
jgi:NAD(P)-dependent dehydrogenase (short-subunit alcohol dehydrogenase family)